MMDETQLDPIVTPLKLALGRAFEEATRQMVDDPAIDDTLFVMGSIKAHALTLAASIHAACSESANSPVVHAVAKSAMLQFALDCVVADLGRPISAEEAAL